MSTMDLDVQQRKEIISITNERLSLVIGASGNAEELVSLVTQIVKALKKLIGGAPEATKTKGTSTLAEFVFAAKKIAQDARAVDSNSLQQLSSTRKAVESLVKELDSFYESQQKSSRDIDLHSLLKQPTSIHSRPIDPVNAVSRVSPIDPPPTTEREHRLAVELQNQLEVLHSKAEPQKNPVQHGEPSDVLTTAMTGLQRATVALVEVAGHKAPAKALVLEPTLILSKMVSMLMDLVDSLFVSKYPMRTQVYSFCCMLIDNALVYGEQSKMNDAASLRLISTQAPALMSTLEVMAEQCYKRSENIKESQKMSIQRGVDLQDLDRIGPGQAKSPSIRRRKEPPLPPGKAVKRDLNPPSQIQEFEIVCMICTNVAVDSVSHEILTKGTEIKLTANSETSVKDVRKTLCNRTGLPIENIQIRFRGNDVLMDEIKVTPNNPIPYFVFNMCEPDEEELQDFKKKHRRKQKMRIEDADWSKVPSPVAVALYDYESLGDTEDDSLEFEEGELIEIIEKSGDGWWTGRIDGKVGVIPASFVEEINIPQSKEEAKKLVKKYRQGKLGAENHTETKMETISYDGEPRSLTSSPSPSASAPSHNPLAGVGKAIRRIHSGGSNDYSKVSKKSTEPMVKDKKEKKRSSLFKKRNTSHDLIMEYKEVRSSPTNQGSPLLSSPSNRKQMISVPEQAEEPQSSPPVPLKQLSRHASSPRLIRSADKAPVGEKLRSGSSTSPLTAHAPERPLTGDSSLKVKRRPPPRPPPYQKTYPRSMSEDIDTEPIKMPLQEKPGSEHEVVLTAVKTSSSMEDLLKDLEEFDELTSPSPLLEVELGTESGERDFATIPRNELPPKAESSESSPELQSRQIQEDLAAPQKPPRKRSKKKPEPPSTSAVPPPELRFTDMMAANGLHIEATPEGQESPLPQPPPRRKSQKGTAENNKSEKVGQSSPIIPPKPVSQEKQSPLLHNKRLPLVAPKPSKISPTPPPKPKGLSKPIPGWRVSLEKPASSSAPVSRTVSPDDHSKLSTGTRETSVSTDLLTSSPVVMRRTNAVNATLDPEFSDDELKDCSGIGKEGVLHKEGAKKVEWKSRYFRITHTTVDYFETAADANSSPALGQMLVSRMQGAVPLGEKDGFQCFAINMKYDTSVILGCHSRTDMNDWVKSINKMVKEAKCGEMIQTYSILHRVAAVCVEYLMKHVVEDRALVSAAAPSSMVNHWLNTVDRGMEPDISNIPNATTAACLLRSLFNEGRLGFLIKYSLAKDMVELTQSANPISILSNKLDRLSTETKDLLKQLLRLFAKVLEYSHKNSTELDDLNQTFGPLIFERMTILQTQPLLAYLISTCELIIS